jgi:hypothetical protein
VGSRGGRPAFPNYDSGAVAGDNPPTNLQLPAIGARQNHTSNALHYSHIEGASSKVVNKKLTVLEDRVRPLPIGDRSHCRRDWFLPYPGMRWH